MAHEDAWKLDSNLPATMDFTVHSAYFSTSADYQNSSTYQIYLIGSDEDGNAQEIRMAVGQDWTSSDGGRTVHHPNPRKHIHKNSIYGHWISSAVGIEDQVQGRTIRDILFESEPTNAEIWNNLQLHLERTEITFGRGLEPREYLLPTGFLGIYEEAELPLRQSPPPATVVPQVSEPTSNGTPLFAEMILLAKSSGSFNEFISTAFARDDVRGDDELAKQIADEKNGIWSLR